MVITKLTRRSFPWLLSLSPIHFFKMTFLPGHAFGGLFPTTVAFHCLKFPPFLFNPPFDLNDPSKPYPTLLCARFSWGLIMIEVAKCSRTWASRMTSVSPLWSSPYKRPRWLLRTLTENTMRWKIEMRKMSRIWLLLTNGIWLHCFGALNVPNCITW